jgi:hypothetical protein
MILDMTLYSLVCRLCKGVTLSVETLCENNGRRRVHKLIGINLRQWIFRAWDHCPQHPVLKNPQPQPQI